MADRVRVFCTGYPSLDHVARVRSAAGSDVTHLIEVPWTEPTFGGCAANVAVGLAHLGVPTGLAFPLGNDPEGRAFLASLEERGIDTAGVTLLEGSTARSYFFVDPEGHYHLFFDPGTSRGWSPERWDYRGASWALLTVAPRAAALSFAQAAAQASLRLIWQLKRDTDAFPPDAVRALLPLSSVVIMNRHEARYVQEVLGIPSEAELLRIGPELVVVTEGDAGAVAWGRAGMVAVPAVPATFVDATGAGDGFTAGLLWGLAEGWEVGVAARVGAVVASCVVEAPGAQAGLPSPDRVRRRYQETFGEELPSGPSPPGGPPQGGTIR